MGAQLRVYRRRIRTVQSTRKITKAMELIAASRIVRAQNRMNAARPYAEELTRALAALGEDKSLKHPMLTGVENPAPGRHPGHHQRPGPGRRLQRERDQAGQRAGRAARVRGQRGRPVRHRTQGRGLLQLPAHPAGRLVDRLLRAAELPRCPPGDRVRGRRADRRGRRARRGRHRRAVCHLHPVREQRHPDRDGGEGVAGPGGRGRQAPTPDPRAAKARSRSTSSSPRPTS